MNSFRCQSHKRVMFLVTTLSRWLPLSIVMTLLVLSDGARAQANNVSAPLVQAIGATTGVPEGTSGHTKWMMYRDKVAEVSQSEIEITPMVSGGLGSEETILNSLRRGRVQIANLSGLVIGTLAPEVALLQAPYLFDDQGEADYVYDTVLLDIFRDLLSEYGLTLLSWDEVGFHHVYGKSPRLTPADLQDTRFRVSSGLPAQLFAEAMGADVIPLSFTENVVGLQTGLVDGGANAVILYASTGMAEEASHLTMTGHILATNFVIASSRWLEGLTAAHRDIITQNWVPMDIARAMSRGEENDFLSRAGQIGYTIHTLSPEQRTEWKRAAAPVTNQIIESVGGQSQAIYDAILAGKTAYQAQKNDR